MVHQHMRSALRRVAVAGCAGAAALGLGPAGAGIAATSSLPAGSTAIGAMRGVPDVAFQASSRTGVLVYDTAPGDTTGGLTCPSGNPCSAGWYVVGGTSRSAPQWAGLVAIADQIAGHGLGQINPALYALAAGAGLRHVLLRRDQRRPPGGIRSPAWGIHRPGSPRTGRPRPGRGPANQRARPGRGPRGRRRCRPGATGG